jgi:hypothetical protein
MAIRLPKGSPPTLPPGGSIGASRNVENKGVALRDGGDEHTAEASELKHNEASSDVRAVVGDAAGPVKSRKKSAGTRGALAGVQRADAEEGTKPSTPRWKKAVLAALMGITVLNAVAPTVASAQEIMPTTSPVQVEQVVEAETFANPLLARIANQGGAFDIDRDVGVDPDARDNPDVNLAELGGVDIGGADKLPPDVQEVADQAIERFGDRLDNILNRDAGSLARGETMWQPGDSLTDRQADQLQDALKDMIEDLPAGALSESLTGPLRTLLDNNGVDTTDFATTRLGDLGDYGGDLAENLVEKFRDNHPAAFYATAGVLAAGVTTYGYLEGSEALRDLGIKPELSTDLFGDRLEVELSADWKSKFTEFSGTLDGTYNFGNGHRAGAGVNFDGDNFNPRLSYSFDGQQWDAAVEGQYNTGDGSVDAAGFVNYRPNADLNLRLSGAADSDGDDHLRFDLGKRFDNDSSLNVGVRHVWDDQGDDFTDLNARWRLSRDDLNIDAEAGYRFGDNEGFQGGIGIGYEPAENMEIQFRGMLDQHGEGSIGVGFNWRF